MGEARDRGEAISAREQGIAVHWLLQRLPDMAAEQCEAWAVEHMKKRYSDWPVSLIESVARQACDVVNNSALAMLFGPGSQAEVAVAGTIMLQGRPYSVTGQIDRLCATAKAIWIADYKSDQMVPQNTAEIPQAYLTQMALYRELARSIFPNRSIHCLLVWTKANRGDLLGEDELAYALDRLAKEENHALTQSVGEPTFGFEY